MQNILISSQEVLIIHVQHLDGPIFFIDFQAEEILLESYIYDSYFQLHQYRMNVINDFFSQNQKYPSGRKPCMKA